MPLIPDPRSLIASRGFTLPEALVALVLTAVLAGIGWALVAGAQARLRDRAEREGLTRTLAAGAAALAGLLEGAGADSVAGADLLAPGPDRVTVRVTRGAGLACAVEAGRVVVRSAPRLWTAIRQPDPGRDTVLLRRQDGGWIATALLGSATPAACPDAATGLALPVLVPAAELSQVGPNALVRTVEAMEVRLYSSAGHGWLGLRSPATGEVIQPLAGPLTARTGLALEYLDAGGNPTADAARIAAVRFILRGVTYREHGVGIARSPDAARDSASRLVVLRNLP